MQTNKDYNPVQVLLTDDFLKLLAPNMEGEVLIVTSPGFSKRGVIGRILEGFSSVQVFDDVRPNPELREIDKAIFDLREKKISKVVALGGGSVIDTAKAFSLALCSDEEKPLEANLLKGKDQHWTKRLPLIVIPTTSGTGSEVTPFATIWDEVTNKKYSLTSNVLYPDIAILDPGLTCSLPEKLTMYTCLDAASHALESLWNKNRIKASEEVALESLKLFNENFEALLTDLSNYDLRAKMQLASTYAGLAISHTRTAIAHSISYPMTLEYKMPHGLACSFTLSNILEVHIEKLEEGEEKRVLSKTLKVLKSIDFKKEVEIYTKGDNYSRLESKMFVKERAGNFKYKIDSLREFLSLS